MRSYERHECAGDELGPTLVSRLRSLTTRNFRLKLRRVTARVPQVQNLTVGYGFHCLHYTGLLSLQR